ncbi:thioredoxin [Colletotrichum godetiae]|uniref:Thioredoxin n=1 Tax=Colletotrichum godetiae TaxID=1209918 RepID=A0AAJ0AIZ4_9PEZI|nr:thioredoxin [Colletotrichum godetiae]KAK1674779.1 thioredoxin [Colletotrichum godetiae]
MRLSPLFLFLGSTLLSGVQAAEADKDERENTYFNSMKVPPILELTPDTFDKEVKASQFMLIKHYSPYCPHCMDYAPIYQTLYEWYYTSKPESKEDKTFTELYDFRFATINCVAYFDLCASHNVASYPSTILYKNGELAELIKGVKDIDQISPILEKYLEAAKPGTRPRSLEYPEPGDKTSPEKAASGKTDDSKKSVDDKADAKTDAKTDSKTPAKADEKTPPKEETKAPPKAPPAKEDDKPAGKTDAKADTKGDAKDDAKTGTKTDAKADAKADAKPSTTEKAIAVPTKAVVKKPTVTPNKEGASVPLSAERFQTLVTMTQDPWFVKFYAPWCHHCQAMAPNWQQLAKEMKGRLNIGEVNCDVETRLCKDVRLRGYPTILFFKGGERVEYDGLRGLGDFVHYANKAIDISEGVLDVDAESLAVLEEKEEVIFIYFYDHATTTEDFMALERIPLSLIGRAKLVKTKDPVLFARYKITTWPRLLVSREGRPTYYQPLTPKEMRDIHQVLNWMKSVWLPIVPEMTASNAREIMDGKVVVLGIVNREDQEGFLRAKRELKSAANEWMDKQIQNFQHERQELRDAKQLRIDEADDRGDGRALRAAKAIRINMDKSDRKQVGFAWVDSVFWQRWIRTTYGIDTKDGDRVIINDEDNRRYWDTTITGNNILLSRTSILETINKVVSSPPKIKPKLTISSFEKIFFDIRVTFVEHPYLTMGCILGLAFGAFSWFRSRSRKGRGGHFRLEESWGNKELMKEGLLGPNGNGKVD